MKRESCRYGVHGSSGRPDGPVVGCDAETGSELGNRPVADGEAEVAVVGRDELDTSERVLEAPGEARVVKEEG